MRICIIHPPITCSLITHVTRTLEFQVYIYIYKYNHVYLLCHIKPTHTRTYMYAQPKRTTTIEYSNREHTLITHHITQQQKQTKLNVTEKNDPQKKSKRAHK